MGTTSLTKGKRAEFLVLGELISQECELYLPIIDKGIDAILRKKDGTYVEIQVKSTEKETQAGCFNIWDLDLIRPEESFFIVCVDMSKTRAEGKPEVWVFTAKVFQEYAIPISSKEGMCYRLDLNAASRKHGNMLRREILKEEHLEAWHLLTD